jgi:hypothetical protein
VLILTGSGLKTGGQVAALRAAETTRAADAGAAAGAAR